MMQPQLEDLVGLFAFVFPSFRYDFNTVIPKCQPALHKKSFLFTKQDENTI